MKKIVKIFSLGLAVAVVSIILASIGQPVITALAHDFPHDLRDWGKEDWEKFYEYQNKYYYENNPYDNRQNSYVGYYNGHAVYWNGSHYYYIGDDGCQYYCDDYYRQPYQSYQQPYQQPQYNYNGYGNYNYYSGVISNAYDANTEYQAQILAKIMYLYAHGVASQTQQACVGWAVMNSIDASGGGVDIGSIAPNFHYDSSKPTTDDFGRDLMPLARDVIFRWQAGRSGISNNGRVLPAGYCWVWSTGSTVYFRNTANESGAVWNYSYQTPYGS